MHCSGPYAIWNELGWTELTLRTADRTISLFLVETSCMVENLLELNDFKRIRATKFMKNRKIYYKKSKNRHNFFSILFCTPYQTK